MRCTLCIPCAWSCDVALLILVYADSPISMGPRTVHITIVRLPLALKMCITTWVLLYIRIPLQMRLMTRPSRRDHVHFAMIMLRSIFICFVCHATYAVHCFIHRRCGMNKFLLFVHPPVVLLPSYMMSIWPDQLPFWIRRHFNLLCISVIIVPPRPITTIVMVHRTSRITLIKGSDSFSVTCSHSSRFLPTILPFKWSGLCRRPLWILMTIRASTINMISSSAFWFMRFILPIKWSSRLCMVVWLDIRTISVGLFSHIHVSIIYIIMIKCSVIISPGFIWRPSWLMMGIVGADSINIIRCPVVQILPFIMSIEWLVLLCLPGSNIWLFPMSR